MNNEILIERLKSLGFKEYESKVLIVLLKGIPMSASEIAKEANIIRNSIYDILKNFVEKGYCNEIETNTILNYQIIDPAIILDKIRHDYKVNYEHRLTNLQETFDEMRSIFEKASEVIEAPEKNIQLIRGFNKHRVAKYIKMVTSSKFEILGMHSPRRVVVEELSQETKHFIKSGGEVRSLYQVGEDDKSNEELIKACELFEKGGEKVRLSDFQLPNIIICDKENIFINLSTDKTVPKHKQADIIIKNSDFASHLCDLFNSYWGKALTLEEFRKKRKNHGI